MLDAIAGYFAPVATIIAAFMTAANLGPRTTGWGFVVFTCGSLTWCAIAVATGQQNLLITNAALTVVNAFGIWRWLRRIARFDDGAKAAEAKSSRAETPSLINIGAIEGRTVTDRSGSSVGGAVGVMAVAASGRIAYVVAGIGGVGGLGERLVALPWEVLTLKPDRICANLGLAEIKALDEVDPADWPHRGKPEPGVGAH